MASIVSQRVSDRVEEFRRTFRGAKPFPHVVLDDFLEPDLAGRLVDGFPTYDEETFKNEWNELGKAWHENVPALGAPFAELDAGLRSPEFLGLVSRVSGISDLLFDPHYFGGGTHENLHGMELDPHIDFNVHPKTKLHRRLNLLLYLNDEWDDAWGGALELHTNPWLHPDENEIQTISPRMNRCVIFETSDHSWHGFRRLSLPEEKRHLSRKSFAMYLYTQARPPLQMIPHDITIYTDRPLPENIRAGHALSADDVYELECLLARRDRKLEYLYGRAIDYAQKTLEEEEATRAPMSWVEKKLRGAVRHLARRRGAAG